LAGATFAEERLLNAPRESRDDQLHRDEQASSDDGHEEPDVQRVDWKKVVDNDREIEKANKGIGRGHWKKRKVIKTKLIVASVLKLVALPLMIHV
jgi:hypothetical protein